MDDQLKAKLLANDEISLQIEDIEEQEHANHGDLFTNGFRKFFKNPEDYERAVCYKVPLSLWE
jgi:hypothetical protein